MSRMIHINQHENSFIDPRSRPGNRGRGRGPLLSRIVRTLLRLFRTLTLAGVGLAIGIALFYSWSWFTHRTVLPGVVILQMPVGGLATADAAALLTKRWAAESTVVSGFNQTIQASPAEMGFILHAEATLSQANAPIHSRDPEKVIAFYRSDRTVNPLISLDDQAATHFLKGLATQIEREAINAGVVWDGARFVESPAVVGETIDIPATIARWRAHAAVFHAAGPVPLITKTVPPAVLTTASQVEGINQMVDQPLELRLFDPLSGSQTVYTIPPQMWVPWLSFEGLAGEGVSLERPAWQIDRLAIAAALTDLEVQFGLAPYQQLDPALTESLAERVVAHMNGTTAENPLARVYYKDRIHLVQPGETIASISRDYGFPYPWVQKANPGVESLAIGQQLIIPSPDVLLPLPVVTHKRIEISLSEQRMRAYENGVLKWDWPISSGIAESPTSPGLFQIQSHAESAYAENWDLHMPYFMGIYQPVPGNDFMNGFHGFPTRDGSQLLWTNSLGRPVTYGCILVDNAVVTDLYEWAEPGVIVKISQ